MEQGSHEREQESNKGALPDESPVPSDTVEEVSSEIGQVLIPVRQAKLGAPIKVEMSASPGGRAYFSIAQFPRASQVAMAEDPENPGHYRGEYLAQVGDRVEDAEITVVFTDDSGTISTLRADERVAIDTIPPTLTEVKVTPLVRNEGIVEIEVETKPNSEVMVDVSQLDTTADDVVVLKEVQTKPGTYRGQFTISKDNNAKNGIKLIQLSVKDELGNEGEGVISSVELKNSELSRISALTSNEAKKLEAKDIYTLADLRRIDVERVAQDIGISSIKLGRHQAIAKFLAIGIEAELAQALVYLEDINSPTQLALTSPKKVNEIIQAGIQQGIISQEGLEAKDLPNQLINAGVKTTERVIAFELMKMQRAQNTCQAECADELSVFGCYAYLLELVNLTEMKWGELKKRFKQDFLDATNTSINRIDIAIKVLELAIKEDLNIRERLPRHWEEYDQALNRSLVLILGESVGKAERWEGF